MKFWKVEAIGNDFPLVRLEEVSEAELPDLAREMSDRKFGVGGDGLLAFGIIEGAPTLRMFNPDGTEDFCGNGLRAATRWAFDQGLISAETTLSHRGLQVPVKVSGEQVQTTLPGASFDPKAIPMLGPERFDAEIWAGMESGMPLVIRGSALTTGSTHVVIPTGALPNDENFFDISKLIENDSKFPERTSVIWSKREAERAIAIRIWERGVGETQGCGTGSAAAAVDYARRNGYAGDLTVRNPGGTVTIRFNHWSDPITITGTASTVYEGEWLRARAVADPTAHTTLETTPETTPETTEEPAIPSPS